MYLIKDFANAAKVSAKTISRRIKELKDKRKFKKKSPGRYFNDQEAEQLQQLIGFSIKK